MGDKQEQLDSWYSEQSHRLITRSRELEERERGVYEREKAVTDRERAIHDREKKLWSWLDDLEERERRLRDQYKERSQQRRSRFEPRTQDPNRYGPDPRDRPRDPPKIDSASLQSTADWMGSKTMTNAQPTYTGSTSAQPPPWSYAPLPTQVPQYLSEPYDPDAP